MKAGRARTAVGMESPTAQYVFVGIFFGIFVDALTSKAGRYCCHPAQPAPMSLLHFFSFPIISSAPSEKGESQEAGTNQAGLPQAWSLCLLVARMRL